jgi:hypothetical protein
MQLLNIELPPFRSIPRKNNPFLKYPPRKAFINRLLVSTYIENRT